MIEPAGAHRLEAAPAVTGVDGDAEDLAELAVEVREIALRMVHDADVEVGLCPVGSEGRWEFPFGALCRHLCDSIEISRSGSAGRIRLFPQAISAVPSGLIRCAAALCAGKSAACAAARDRWLSRNTQRLGAHGLLNCAGP